MYEVIIDFPGSPDGCRVLQYEKGQILNIGTDFPTDLAEVALAEKWVVKVAEKKAPKPKKAKK